jgi:MSHA biogenesis protein MshO
MTQRILKQAGFTLIEAIVVITATAILSAAVAVFLRKPIDQYLDLDRRSAITDIADTAARRVSRDLHLALPNSVRTVGNQCLEFLPTTTGGRYRADVDSNGAGNVFQAGPAITQFDVIGAMPSIPNSNDQVVVYNLGVPGADAYEGLNRSVINAATATTLTFASKAFPFASPANRFQVISGTEQAVFYVCNNAGKDANGNGTGSLLRFSGYGINAAAPTVCPVVQPTTPVLASNLSVCNFTYNAGVTERTGLVQFRLGVTQANETVNLYHDVHISNVP